MPNLETNKMRIRAAADLVAAVPYLLGFHLTDSLAVIAVKANRVAFAMRADLPTRDASRQHRSALAARVADIVRQQGGITAVMLVGYGPPERVTPMIDATRLVFARDGVPVVDALRVTDNRYYSYVCVSPDCCPPEGVAFDASTSAIAAAATVAGMVALPTRADLARQIAPVSGPARHAMGEATRRAVARLTCQAGTSNADGQPPTRLGRTAVRRALHRHRHNTTLTDDEMAWLTVVLQNIAVRDFAWQRSGDQHHQLSLWMDATRRADATVVSAPASLLAFTAWQQGNGTLAMLAIDRALDGDPTYRMALLLADVLHRGIPPTALSTWPPPSHR